MTGLYDEHRNFGYLDPSENHGFSRKDTMFPTTDPERMRAFFVSELERRNVPQADLDEGERILQSFFLSEEEAEEAVVHFSRLLPIDITPMQDDLF